MRTTAVGSIAASPIARVTKRAPEAKDIGAHEQQPRNVRRFKRARQAAHQVERPALRAELVKLHDLEMRQKPAASLVARVEHCALEAEFLEPGEESEVGVFVGKHHADKGDLAREPAQRLAKPIKRRRIHGELEIVYAHCGQRSRAFEQRFFIVGRIAEGGARFASARDSRDRLARNIEGDGSERAPPGVFQIDDVGAKLHDNFGLSGVGDTGEHASHRIASYSCGRRSHLSARLPARNSAKSDATVNFRGLIGRKLNLIIVLERKRKCTLLRLAPFSRLRS